MKPKPWTATHFLRATRLLSGIIVTLLFTMSHAVAQNINITTPRTSVSDSYFENFGLNFGFSLPGGRGNGSRIVGLGPQGRLFPNPVFQQNLGGFPPFGGFNPGAGARFGFGRVSPNGGGFSLGGNFAKGSSRSSITSAPSLTVPNGFGGSIFSGGSRPFVTGIIPVVGGANGGIDNGVTRALNSGQLDLTYRPSEAGFVPSGVANYSNQKSSALHGDSSVNQIKAARQKMIAEKDRLFNATIAEAKALEAEGEFLDARSKYRKARTQTDDPLKRRQIKAWIKAARPK